MKMLTIQFLFLDLFVVFLILCNVSSLSLEKTKFQKMLIRNKKILHSTKIENYLRKLVLSNNDIKNNTIVFIDESDLDVNPNEINYILQKDSDENEFRARLFAYKYAKNLNATTHFTPLTAVHSDEVTDRNWDAFDILLTGGNENEGIKICLNKNREVNFAVAVKVNEKCSDIIAKIEKLKIINIE